MTDCGNQKRKEIARDARGCREAQMFAGSDTSHQRAEVVSKEKGVGGKKGDETPEARHSNLKSLRIWGGETEAAQPLPLKRKGAWAIIFSGLERK